MIDRCYDQKELVALSDLLNSGGPDWDYYFALAARIVGAEKAPARVLDAGCGTGALALEALSRGALSATLIDNSNAALSTARANAASLDETDAVTLLRADARHPPTATLAHTLVFLDPPYGKDRAPEAIRGLDAAGWIAQGALIAVETGRTEDLDLPEGFTLEDQRRYGRAKISLVTKD